MDSQLSTATISPLSPENLIAQAIEEMSQKILQKNYDFRY